MEQIAAAMALIGLFHKVGLLVERFMQIRERLHQRDGVDLVAVRQLLADARSEAQALVGIEGVSERAKKALNILAEVDSQLEAHGPALQDATNWALEKIRQARELYEEEVDELFGERREEMAERIARKLLPAYRAKLAGLGRAAGLLALLIALPIMGLTGCARWQAGTETHGREVIAPLPDAPGAFSLYYEFPAATPDGVPIDSADDVTVEVIEDSAGGKRVSVGTVWQMAPAAPDLETGVR